MDTEEVEIPSDAHEEKEGTDDDGPDSEPDDVSGHEYPPVMDGLDQDLYDRETEESATQSSEQEQEGGNGNEADKTAGEGKSIAVLQWNPSMRTPLKYGHFNCGNSVQNYP